MLVKDFLKKVNLNYSDVTFYYKNITDDKPVEVEIINSTRSGDCEIIRLSQINGRKHYGGFFVPINILWIKTDNKFTQIGTWLKELEKLEN
jgi:hypothetical protein